MVCLSHSLSKKSTLQITWAVSRKTMYRGTFPKSCRGWLIAMKLSSSSSHGLWHEHRWQIPLWALFTEDRSLVQHLLVSLKPLCPGFGFLDLWTQVPASQTVRTSITEGCLYFLFKQHPLAPVQIQRQWFYSYWGSSSQTSYLSSNI